MFAACVVVVIGGALLFRMQPVGPPPGGPVAVPEPVVPQGDPGERFSPEERHELLKLSHQVVGLMENNLWRPALKVIEKIGAKFPEDPFAARNAAVIYSHAEFALWSPDKPEGMKPEEAEAAAERLLKISPDDGVSHVLAARIATKCGNPALAMQRYGSASGVDPRSAVAWYELAETLRNNGGLDAEPGAPDVSKTLQLAAMRKVSELSPENLRVPVDLLNLMLELRDNSIAKYLQDLAPQMQRVRRAALERFGNDSFPKLYENAVQAALKAVQTKTPQEWSAAAVPVRFLINSLPPLDPVFMDMGRLRPNPLDYLQHRFQSAAFNDISADTPESHPAIPVKFTPSLEQLPVTESPGDLKFGDFNLDQRPDLWLLTAGQLRIFGTTQGSAKWSLLSELTVPEGLTQFLAQDLDWDDFPAGSPQPQPEPTTPVASGDDKKVCQQADSDLILYGPAGIRIWKNDLAADGTSRDWVAIEKTGLEALTDITTVAVADIDHEGDLDLALGTTSGLQLWSNRENFNFKDISEQSTLPKQQFAVRQIIPVDFDRDVDLDLLVFGAGDATVTCGMLVNRLHGVLEWRTFAQQGFKEIPEKLRRALLIDADRNVSWDLIGLGVNVPVLALTQTHGAGQTITLRTDSLPDVLKAGVVSTDYDNDGILDLVTWGGKQLKVLQGGMNGEFTVKPDLVSAEAAAEIQDCLSVDLDHDGDLDLVVRTTKVIQILTNEGGNRNHWLDVRLRARRIVDANPSPEMALRRVNHQGIGSVLEIEAGGYYLPQLVTGGVTHFGLGQRTEAELVRVVWTNGVPQGILDVKGDLEICEVQAPKGSCPFVYTWNGERYEFFTDLLWNAPLGLQFAEGVLAPSRAWEYLKIPGHRLLPQGDKYVLRITEELWEATYFDQVELLAVDHPEDVNIYSNEKVGPPSLAEFKIHTVRQPRPVIAAKDQRGRDVWTEIAAEDGQFTKSYDRVLRQGLTTPHHLELDLGPINQSGPLTLFLTGWMYPTETSISVAVSQNPGNAQARPPALWVPDAKGEWQEIRPFMGFPGGKTKTIAIDLTGVFVNHDHRLRIVTNMQFHWDHAFYSVGETPAEIKLQPLKLVSADLHYRGLSEHSWPAGNGPDQYDYSTVLPGPDWPPMQGKFTRLGDVRELLTQADDRLVVIGAGDEMTLTFTPAETPVPAGWKRDFILHNVGWDKDADLNTVHGQTVEPLPFNAMSGYPYPAHEGPADTAEYRAYLKKYQTREQSFSKFWRRLKAPVPTQRR